MGKSVFIAFLFEQLCPHFLFFFCYCSKVIKSFSYKLCNNNGISLYSDYDEFLAELEEDPAVRQQVNIYKDSSKLNMPQIAVDSDDQVDPTVPDITLEEMLDDLTIDDSDMAEVYE